MRVFEAVIDFERWNWNGRANESCIAHTHTHTHGYNYTPIHRRTRHCHLQIGGGDPHDASRGERGGDGGELGRWPNRVERALRFRQRVTVERDGPAAAEAAAEADAAASSSSSRREAEAAGPSRDTEGRHTGCPAYI